MILAVYNLAVGLLSFAALPALAVRSLSRGERWAQWIERLGALPTPLHQTRPGCVWLHCVSVGEVLASQGLIAKLRERLPERKILLSVGTPTGRQMAEEKCSKLVDGVFFIPYDLGWAVRRTFAALRPGLLVVMETEIWPNVFREAKRHGAGLLIANGRISDRSLPRYRRLRGLFSRVLVYADAILAQSAQDAKRFVAIGAPADIVAVAGNVKYDFQPGNAELAEDLAAFLDEKAGGPLVVAGSTREDEEGVVAEAFNKLAAAHPGAFLVVAPRHPQRTDDAERALVESGLAVRRRSRLGAEGGAATALLVDTLGELSALYKRADLVFVGGSLNGWGGHNVLEAALFGKPIAVGPHMQNFREIADRLYAAEALLEIADADSLAATWLRLLAAPDEAERLGRNASEVAQSARGAVERIVERATTLLRESAPRVPPGFWARLLLGPLAAAWAMAARMRRWAYAAGLLNTEALPRFTVCIGNLTAGGTGKTPAVLRAVEALCRSGLEPAILTRGYGRKSKAPVLLAPGDVRSPLDIGDEPAILADRLFCSIGVGADRIAVGKQLLEQCPIDVFVLDDGYQRLSVGRDFNLVLVDVTRPFETDSCLPLGRLREPLDGLARADAVLLTRTLPGHAYDSLVARIRRLNPAAPVFRSRTRPLRLTETRFREEVQFQDVLGRKAFAFSGIGNPDSFVRGLEDLGMEVVGSLPFPDHHRYTLDDWWNIAAAARDSGAELTITTQKDLVNLSAEAPQDMRTGAPPLHVLDIDLVIDDYDALIDLIERGVEAYGK